MGSDDTCCMTKSLVPTKSTILQKKNSGKPVTLRVVHLPISLFSSYLHIRVFPSLHFFSSHVSLIFLRTFKIFLGGEGVPRVDLFGTKGWGNSNFTRNPCSTIKEDVSFYYKKCLKCLKRMNFVPKIPLKPGEGGSVFLWLP